MFLTRWCRLRTVRLLQLILLPALCRAAESRPAPQGAPAVQPGLAEFVSEIMLNDPFLLTGPQRDRLDELNRRYREADNRDKNIETPRDRERLAATRAAMASELVALLESLPEVIRVSIREDRVQPSLGKAVTLPGSSGALLLRIDQGAGPTRYVAARQDLAILWTDPVELNLAGNGVTWAVIGFSNVPDARTTKELDLLRPGQERLRLTLDLLTPPKGRLRLSVVSHETGQATPAMVRLTWKTDGNPVMPGNAIEFGPQFDNQGTVSGRRFTSLPGRLGGIWWCVPGPFDMHLPPGEYEIAVRRGLEHVPVFETVVIGSGTTLERTVRIHQWTDMGALGWYSGDDHIHCRIQSDEDASRLMIWAQAEDVHLVNVVEMGDWYRTYFEQRGFGREYRVAQGDYTLSPGQECPRTHGELGHTLAMNTTSMVRDTDRYFLYDWVFDTVHAQGGLTGYAHVFNDGFWVHCDMSINVPANKVDFAEILQFNVLGTSLYYSFLNLGCRLTAAAGSDVPWGGTIGDVRMYSYVGQGPFSADSWFEGVRQGHTFVTSGPMIEFHVDDALPGDTLAVSAPRKLRVRARTWGHPGRSLPAALEIVTQGEVIKRIESTDGKTDALSLEFDLDSANGFWIAARTWAADGTSAHTTPVYVVREGLRFWKHEAAGPIIDQMLVYLGEIEKKAVAAQGQDEAARRANLKLRLLGDQAPELLKRIQAARVRYAELKMTIQREVPLRTRR